VRGLQAPRQTVPRPSSALSNLGRSPCPAIPGMERYVTNIFIDRRKQTARSAAHEHDPTPAEIQRWEDDGGAVSPPPAPIKKSAEQQVREPLRELVAA
jgi:hypothetical protein